MNCTLWRDSSVFFSNGMTIHLVGSGDDRLPECAGGTCITALAGELLPECLAFPAQQHRPRHLHR